jgi:hypothetical protein
MRTCWLRSRIAMSFRSVNSWNAASIVDTCVSRVGSESIIDLSNCYILNVHTSVHNKEVLLLVGADMSHAGEEKASHRVLSRVS